MLQAWKKRNVPFYDSEDLFFPQIIIIWQHVKKIQLRTKLERTFFLLSASKPILLCNCNLQNCQS